MKCNFRQNSTFAIVPCTFKINVIFTMRHCIFNYWTLYFQNWCTFHNSTFCFSQLDIVLSAIERCTFRNWTLYFSQLNIQPQTSALRQCGLKMVKLFYPGGDVRYAQCNSTCFMVTKTYYAEKNGWKLKGTKRGKISSSKGCWKAHEYREASCCFHTK